jgi:hypothetical protein
MVLEFSHTDLDEYDHERSARLLNSLFQIDIAYQFNDNRGDPYWSVVIIAYMDDMRIANKSQRVAADLDDAALSQIAQELLPEVLKQGSVMMAEIWGVWSSWAQELTFGVTS